MGTEMWYYYVWGGKMCVGGGGGRENCHVAPHFCVPGAVSG